MHDLQPEGLLKGIEIVAPVQQFVLGLQTERCNQAINRPADGVPEFAQIPVVLGSGNGQGTAAGGKNLELQEIGLDLGELFPVPNALQYFAEDKICQPEPLPLQFAIQPSRFGVFGATQIVDPHSRIDDDHCRAYSRTRTRRDWLR